MKSSTATAPTPMNIHFACTNHITVAAFLVAEARFQTPSVQMIIVQSTSGQCR